MSTYAKTDHGLIVKNGNIYIPEDENNIEYKEYLIWLKEGNVPTIFQDVDLLTMVRGIRNTILEKSDWTQLSDNSLTDAKKEEWKTYRQQLRDYPDNWTIEKPWPLPPV